MKFCTAEVLLVLVGGFMLGFGVGGIMGSYTPCADLTVHTGREVKEHAGICYVKTRSGWVPRENWLVVESE